MDVHNFLRLFLLACLVPLNKLQANLNNMKILFETKKHKYSFVYCHIFVYRLILNILFLGCYKLRFKKVIAMIDSRLEKKVVELCFGDIYIAKWCKCNEVDYVGFDINLRG